MKLQCRPSMTHNVQGLPQPPNRMTFPAEPHNKYILFNGEANTMQACGKPHVVRRSLVEIIKILEFYFMDGTIIVWITV